MQSLDCWLTGIATFLKNYFPKIKKLFPKQYHKAPYITGFEKMKKTKLFPNDEKFISPNVLTKSLKILSAKHEIIINDSAFGLGHRFAVGFVEC
ncbi:hypothetical protein BBW65_03060 [Helicobacter enhydrae]|uniref:Uncharacterized protein n=1 Tax=Helicobacter enhydrae TaxID=222136 RepID=A0A1B1U503_9HELI|nr:hypothetical protein [Helicobacter enhydrae]ANV97843.1 hypothetical protein BBW65_03060 [Helicobacter enhydrae]